MKEYIKIICAVTLTLIEFWWLLPIIVNTTNTMVLIVGGLINILLYPVIMFKLCVSFFEKIFKPQKKENE